MKNYQYLLRTDIRMKKKYLDPLKISIDHSYSEYPRIYFISLNIKMNFMLIKS